MIGGLVRESITLHGVLAWKTSEFDLVYWDMYKAMRREEKVQLRPSKKPLMKLFGRRAFGSSSARKYFRICGNCFQ